MFSETPLLMNVELYSNENYPSLHPQACCCSCGPVKGRHKYVDITIRTKIFLFINVRH